MDLSNELIHYQNAFKIQSKITFEAHYWGKFRLLPIQNISAQKGLLFFAESNSHPYNQKLAIQSNQIFLVRPDERLILIANTLADFFGPIEKWQELFSIQEKHFDNRKRIENLLSPENIILTKINDPEYFEEAAAYLEIVKFCNQLSNNIFGFDRMLAKETMVGKQIELSKGKKNWVIILDKILYDNQIIIQLNKILKDLGYRDFIFATSINEQMRMLILKLKPAELSRLTQMGLLI